MKSSCNTGNLRYLGTTALVGWTEALCIALLASKTQLYGTYMPIIPFYLISQSYYAVCIRTALGRAWNRARKFITGKLGAPRKKPDQPAVSSRPVNRLTAHQGWVYQPALLFAGSKAINDKLFETYNFLSVAGQHFVVSHLNRMVSHATPPVVPCTRLSG